MEDVTAAMEALAEFIDIQHEIMLEGYKHDRKWWAQKSGRLVCCYAAIIRGGFDSPEDDGGGQKMKISA